ncbi:hypothetical protein GCM10009678_56000 [Actinomadura kijaniata]
MRQVLAGRQGLERKREPGVTGMQNAAANLDVYDPPASPPTWSGKPAGNLTAAEALDVLVYMEANRLGDETLAQVLAGILVSRSTSC